MDRLRLRAFPIVLGLSALAGAGVAVAYLLALTSLASGPNMTGYGYLELANGSLPVLAGLAVVVVASRVELARTRYAVGGLALASGIVAGVGVGLATLGSTLANYQPEQQTPELNSLLLAVLATGTQIAPAAVVLAAGALLIAVVCAFVRWIRLDFYDRSVAERRPEPVDA